MKQQQDNLNVIKAACKQLEDNGYKPNQVTLTYKDLPPQLKSKEDGFKDEDIVSCILKDGEPIIKLYES